ncbi:translation initiation factor IF-2 [Spirochaeta cellobiosiphila]|uniref:translation initiation factor IF-2 n=1 Tax=Spirochaeta cellobiosiphila TaxID=504483 RepID=UPI00040252CB|nr:translation initiation factor IF-2 [Spirochaeta cellobiosiphila]
MPEDKKEKPKATLIKHKKSTDVPEKDEKQEKKKVVVVKKTHKVVKKTHKVVAKKNDEDTDETFTKNGSPDKKTSGNYNNDNRERRPRDNQGYRSNSDRSNNNGGSGRFDNRRSNTGRDNNSRNTNYRDRDNNNRPQGERRNYRDRDQSQSNNVNRPRYPKRESTGDAVRRPFNKDNNNRQGNDRRPNSRPGNNSGGRGSFNSNRPGGNNRGGYAGGNNRSGGNNNATAQPSITDGKKTSAKKFKAKKSKNSFVKKREEHTEKMFTQKKKSIQKANPVPKEIDIMEVITVSELARKMNLKASDLIGKLMGMGMMVTINQQIDADTATLLAEEYKCKVNLVSLYDETIIESKEDEDVDLTERPPIVTIMGHVDHGKTKLLDAIRTTNVVAGEYGGITQHIGAYQVTTQNGKVVTFLDTPGHEAFTLMRARGAQITDIVVLVVAANDGVMPQTIEAINHAKEAKVPLIVAINKVDLPEANPDRVKQQLSEYELIPEEWGGSTMFVEISALKRLNIDGLLESILLQSEMMELKANPERSAEGHIIESKVDQGRGVVATVLIEKGKLKIGDSFVGGIHYGKVRAMFNDRGERVKEAGPSMPIEILGFTGIPNSGDPFQVANTEKFARQIGEKRQELKKVEDAKNVKKITLANLYDSIQDGEVQELKVIIKGDVHGSVEALQVSLEKLSTSEIRLHVIHAAAGAIVKDDVYLAAASNAIIVGFHVRPTPQALSIAEEEKVEVRKYNIIYDAVEDIKEAMEGMLSPELKEETIGSVEVRETFKVPKIGVIAGCMVTDGTIRRNAMVNLIRDGIQIFNGKISSLKRFKDDVKEVNRGYECGVGLENYNDLKVGDTIEVYEIREIAKKL